MSLIRRLLGLMVAALPVILLGLFYMRLFWVKTQRVYHCMICKMTRLPFEPLESAPERFLTVKLVVLMASKP